MKLLNFFNSYRFYILTALLLVIGLVFFDRSNLIKQYELRSKLNDLKNQSKYYDQELEKVIKEEKEVLGSMKSIEKYAREKYYLKKNGETVFVIVDKDGNVLKE